MDLFCWQGQAEISRNLGPALALTSFYLPLVQLNKNAITALLSQKNLETTIKLHSSLGHILMWACWAIQQQRLGRHAFLRVSSFTVQLFHQTPKHHARTNGTARQLSLQLCPAHNGKEGRDGAAGIVLRELSHDMLTVALTTTLSLSPPIKAHILCISVFRVKMIVLMHNMQVYLTTLRTLLCLSDLITVFFCFRH